MILDNVSSWCINYVTIQHKDRSKIDSILEELEEDCCALFNSIIPVPDECGVYSQFGFRDPNETEAAWGTRWDAEISYSASIDDNTVCIEFYTTAPPTILYEYMEYCGYVVEAYYKISCGHDLEANYNKSGCGFCGKWHNGKCEYYEYNMTDLESRQLIPEDIFEYADLYRVQQQQED